MDNELATVGTWRPIKKMPTVWRPVLVKYDPDQPRNSHGEFASVSGQKESQDAKPQKQKMSLSDVKPGDTIHASFKHKGEMHTDVTVSQIIHKPNTDYYNIKGTTSAGKVVSVYMSGGTKRLVTPKAAAQQKPEGNKPDAAPKVNQTVLPSQIKAGDVLHTLDKQNTMMYVTGVDAKDAHGMVLIHGLDVTTGDEVHHYVKAGDTQMITPGPNEKPSSGEQLVGDAKPSGSQEDKEGASRVVNASELQPGDKVYNQDGLIGTVKEFGYKPSGEAYVKFEGDTEFTIKPDTQVEIVPGPSHVFPDTYAALKEGDTIFHDGAIYNVVKSVKEGVILQNADGVSPNVNLIYMASDTKPSDAVQRVAAPNVTGETVHGSYSDIKVGDTVHSSTKGAFTVAALEDIGNNKVRITGLDASGKTVTAIRYPTASVQYTPGEAGHAVSGAQQAGVGKPEGASKPGGQPIYMPGKKALGDFKAGDYISHPKMGEVQITSIKQMKGWTKITGLDKDKNPVTFGMSGAKLRSGRFLVSAGGEKLSGNAARTFLDEVHQGKVTLGHDMPLSKPFVFDSSKVTESEKEATITYTGGAYGKMNGFLRGDAQYAQYKTYCDQCNSALNKQLTEETIVVLRKSYSESAQINGLPQHGAMKLSDLLAIVPPGTVLRDLGFQSTSVSKSVWSGDVQHVITIPPGVPASYVDKISKCKGEQEVIIGAGLASIVTGSRIEGGKLIIERTIIPPALESSIIAPTQQSVFDQMEGFTAHTKQSLKKFFGVEW